MSITPWAPNYWWWTWGSWSWWVHPAWSITNFAVGDLPAGSDISWLNAIQVQQAELIGYVEPTFTSFSVSSFPWNQTSEMGAWFTVSWIQTFSWGTSQPWNVATNSISIIDITSSNTLATWLANDWNEGLDVWTKVFDPVSPSTVSQQYRITWLDTNWWSFNRNFTRTYTFVYPIFEWLVDNISDIFDGMTRAQIATLPLDTVVVSQQNRNVTTSPFAQRYAFVYPQSYWNLSSIIDNNWFETITDYTIVDFNLSSMLDWSTVPYRAYILNWLTTTNNFTNQYIF